VKFYLKQILPVIAFFALSSITAQSYSDNKQQLFLEMMLPAIHQVNNEILQQRTGIYHLYSKHKSFTSLTDEETLLIYRYLKYYRCDVPDDTTSFELTNEHFKELLVKVDVIPAKLVLAQSALESNWGNSRFALEGYNFFGIRCHAPKCGMRAGEIEDDKFMVKSYTDLIAGLRDYFRLLNASSYYEKFRELRIINRMNGHSPKPEEIVHGLENYSSLRYEYIEKLLVIMKTNFDHL